MPKRFTDTDKYRDNWFVDLSPQAKLLFYFLIDNVNIAGFWEISLRSVQFYLDIDKIGFASAIQDLDKGIIFSDNSEILYLKNFLKHQKNLPLNKYNNAHKGILQIFSESIPHFQNSLEHFKVIPCQHVFRENGVVKNSYSEKLSDYLGLRSPIGKGNYKGKESIKGKAKGEPETKVLIFPWTSKEFLNAWENWLEYRKAEHNFSYRSIQSQQAALSELANLTQIESEAIEIIKTTMAQGWKGLQYGAAKLKNNHNGNKNSNSLSPEYRNKLKSKLAN